MKHTNQLVYYPAEILRSTCKPVADLEILHRHDIFTTMKKILKKHNGIGLAAPQIGLNARLVLISPQEDNQFFLINPEILMTSDRQLLDKEGCLSLPDIYGTIIRHESILVKAFTPEGKEIEIETSLLPARIIQHEIDHLDGILFTDKTIAITEGEGKLNKLQKKALPNEL